MNNNSKYALKRPPNSSSLYRPGREGDSSSPNSASLALSSAAEAASGFERRWTKRALRRVDPELANLFEEQEAEFHKSLITGSEADIAEQLGGLVRGYAAITKRMEASGEEDDAYLLGQAGNGLKVAIGHQKAAIGRVQELHGDKVVWMTPDEVAALVAGMQLMGAVKQVWPDAEVVDLHPAEPRFEEAAE